MNSNQNIFDVPEIQLQKATRILLSQTEKSWKTATNEHIQILSIGEWNFNDGPDFRNMAILSDGKVIVGNGEFHKNSTDFTVHKHQENYAFNKLLLHIVLNNNSSENFANFTLVMPGESLLPVLKNLTYYENPAQNTDILALEVLQDFALRRLKRKTEEALVLSQKISNQEAFISLANMFFEKVAKKKTRPKGLGKSKDSILPLLGQSQISKIAEQLSISFGGNFFVIFSKLLEEKIATEGKSTRLEILLNALFPLALAVCGAERQAELFAWFWSLPASQQYSSLRRKFPTLPQDYIWQQQGMLEYLREYGARVGAVGELVSLYRKSKNSR